MQHDCQGQHQRPPPLLPDEHAKRNLPDDGRMRHRIDEPRLPRQPGHVERLILEIGEGPPHRGAIPPRGALQLGDTGKEVNHGHVHLDQPDCQVGPGALCRRLGRARASLAEPAVDRKSGAAGADGQIQVEHHVDLVEPEKRRGHPIGVGDRTKQRENRRDSREQTGGEANEDDHGKGVCRPDPSIRHQVPEGINVLALLDVADQRQAQPPGGCEEIAQGQAPDRVGVQQHRAGQDPDQPQQRGVGRGVPEPVPVGGHRPRCLQEIAADNFQWTLHSNTPNDSLS